MRSLDPGLIYLIARDAGIDVPEKGDKRAICCPFHEDRTESAFLSARNVFYCSVCTPAGGWTAKQFCAELGLDWSRYLRGAAFGPSAAGPRPAPPKPAFSSTEAQHVWGRAYERARNDEASAQDRSVYEYLTSRQLMEAWEVGALGVLPPSADVPEALRTWYSRGYRLVVPLFDHAGTVAGIQARAIYATDPKTVFPKGSRISGTVFADVRAREVLRCDRDTPAVVLGEGLTDSLALSFTSPVPVFCAPGTSNAVAAIGPWVHGRVLYLALDCDAAGNTALGAVANAALEHGATRVRRLVWPDRANDACAVIEKRGILGLEAFLTKQIEQVVA
ncbi:MAG: hypothetical protein IPJ77_11260 [Planctomycetes bacterium]|nr:hypothetical protein [Planctomycetota bacterium]